MNVLYYGLQRSGTNYLEALLRRHYRIKSLNNNRDRSSPLQKHCRLYRQKSIIPEPQYRNDLVVETLDQLESHFNTVPDYYLIISKDPYSWYLSYKNWARKCSWPSVEHHYIEEYNLFYRFFLDIANGSDRFVWLRYADLLKDEKGILTDLEKRINLSKRVLNTSRWKRPEKVAQSDTFTSDREAWYLEEKFLHDYTQEELDVINDHLDPEVTTALGYDLKRELP